MVFSQFTDIVTDFVRGDRTLIPSRKDSLFILIVATSWFLLKTRKIPFEMVDACIDSEIIIGQTRLGIA